jgi:acetyl-CoA acetyltransferase
MTDFERRSIISGVGQSAVGRRLGRSGLDLTIEAALAAIADAGLTPADIDGLATYPGAGGGAGAGFSGPGSPEVQDALRLNLSWHTGGIEGAAQLAAIVNAVLAVGAGLARHVLVYRTVTEATEQGAGGRQGIGLGGGGGGGGAPRMGGTMQWTIPFRAYSAANWLAMVAHRHFHEYGTTPEQMAMIAVNDRRYAGLNPRAVYRDPLTLDDYFASRMVTSPFRLYDCDAPVDGSTAVIVSAAEHAAGVDHPVARVEAVGTALRGRPSWDQFDDMTTMAARDAGAQLWTRTDLKPADVDVAELYDGFSFLAMVWLEALGFCGKGESGPFVEGGHRIALGGELPLNTQGGQLSGGRLHGFGFVHEACVQLRGEAGDRQVAGAEVAAVANGGGPIAGALVLTREG